jgi:hypothetical protein
MQKLVSTLSCLPTSLNAQATWSNSAINAFIATAVLYHETGKSLEYRQLIKHPKYKQLQSSSYAKELGQLCQGFKGTDDHQWTARTPSM